jgi:hypothetical protein
MCTNQRKFGSEKSIELADHSLLKVHVVKSRSLGVIIDDESTWEYKYHIDHLKEKLNSNLIDIINHIMKVIPKSQYHKLYDNLFKSHFGYCYLNHFLLVLGHENT